MDFSQLADRSLRAARLDAGLYEEVEADTTALPQAMLVVVLASVAAGIATLGRAGGLGGVVVGALGALVGWYVWAYLTYWIGTRLLPEPQTEADPGQLLRTLGFAAAPGMIRILGVIRPLLPPVMLVANLWMLVATVVAVRQALDYSGTGRAIAVCVIGWLVMVAFVTVLAGLVGHAGAAPLG